MPTLSDPWSCVLYFAYLQIKNLFIFLSQNCRERERKKKSLPLNCLRWQKWHSGLNIYQLHEINELGEMHKKMTLWLFFKGALAPRRWCFWTARCSNVLRCAASRFDPALIFLPDTDSDTWTLCWHHVCLFRSAVNCREPIKNNKKNKMQIWQTCESTDRGCQVCGFPGEMGYIWSATCCIWLPAG